MANRIVATFTASKLASLASHESYARWTMTAWAGKFGGDVIT